MKQLALKSLGKDSHSQAVMGNTKPSPYTMVEITVVQETAQNHRVVSSVKKD